MVNYMTLLVSTLFVGLLSSAVLVPSAMARDLETVKAEKVGVSSERLNKIDDLAHRYVAQGMFSGIVTMIARDGKIIHQNASGNFGVDNDKPLSLDSLFRIYSMTKPITAAAALILYEEGKFHIDDPVSKYLPEFAEQKILVDGELVTPDSPMTIRQLLTHTAGLTYGWTTDNPVDIAYQEAKLFESKDLQELMLKLADIPLRFQPGTRYHYSVAFDVLGALIERVSGQPARPFLSNSNFPTATNAGYVFSSA